MIDVLAWFDQLKFWTVLSVPPFLLVIEMLLSFFAISASVKRLVLTNLWQVVGVLFPCFWLLRCSDNYGQAIVAVLIMAFFGVYKPTTSTDQNVR